MFPSVDQVLGEKGEGGAEFSILHVLDISHHQGCLPHFDKDKGERKKGRLEFQGGGEG